MSITAVIGGQWGDEGKGKIVDYLCKDVELVARYQGGANAGHTVYIEDAKIVLHQIPSGILRKSCHCILGNGMVIDPIGLLEEIDLLKKFNISISNRLHIAFNAHIVTPFHKVRDQINEKNTTNKIGTTLKGIGPTYVDKYNRVGIRAYDLLNNILLEKYIYDQFKIINQKNDIDKKILDNLEKNINIFFKCSKIISKYVNDTFQLLQEKNSIDTPILIEGAQGTMLDIDHGTYPYVTSSNPTSGGISTGLGLPGNQIKENIGIFKAVLSIRAGI